RRCAVALLHSHLLRNIHPGAGGWTHATFRGLASGELREFAGSAGPGFASVRGQLFFPAAEPDLSPLSRAALCDTWPFLHHRLPADGVYVSSPEKYSRLVPAVLSL